jgi:rare lipoprotein A
MAAAGLLSACASQPHGTSTRQAGHSGHSSGSNSKVMRTASGAKIGAPYQIDGVWYYPQEDPHYDKVGIASWYGPGFDGRPTATGEIYDMNALTAAHPPLPLPTNVEVTNLENGRSLVLRVNDRGPFVGQRVIDVSRRAAQLLGFIQQGTAKVRVRALPDAGSNTMLASAATPSVDTRANVASMPGGNTQLLASSSPSASPSRVASADVRMAPIPNPAAPSSAVTSAQLPPLPTAPAHARPGFGSTPAYARDTAPAVQQQTLASILPPPARQGDVLSQTAAADTAHSYDTASWAGSHDAPAAAPPPSPRLHFVVGPQPAVILSDASRSGAASANTYAGSVPVSSPTIAPTLASAMVSDAGPTQSASQSFGARSPDDGVYIQAGAFVDGDNAEHLRTEVARLGRTDIETASIDGRLFHRVLIGPLASVSEADLTLAKLRRMGHPGARILSR